MARETSDAYATLTPYDLPGCLLRLIGLNWGRHLNAALAKIDLTEMQSIVLVSLFNLLTDRPEGVAQKEIARSCGLSKAVTSSVFKKLVKKGFVEISVNKSDGRFTSVRLTARGEEMVFASLRILEKADQEFWSCGFHVRERLLQAFREALKAKIEYSDDPEAEFGTIILSQIREPD